MYAIWWVSDHPNCPSMGHRHKKVIVREYLDGRHSPGQLQRGSAKLENYLLDVGAKDKAE